MTDYTKLVEALRYCGNFTEREGCAESCEYFNDMDCPNRIMSDAADAIEALQAENPIVETVLVDKMRQQMEELQQKWFKSETDATNLTGKLAQAEADIDRMNLEIDKRIATEIELSNQVDALQAQLPKRGEWIEADGFYKCSVCGELECCRGKYCPDCGAKMEVQNGV